MKASKEIIRDFSTTEEQELCDMYYEAFENFRMTKSGFYVTEVSTYGQNGDIRQSFVLRKAGRNHIN